MLRAKHMTNRQRCSSWTVFQLICNIEKFPEELYILHSRFTVSVIAGPNGSGTCTQLCIGNTSCYFGQCLSQQQIAMSQASQPSPALSPEAALGPGPKPSPALSPSSIWGGLQIFVTLLRHSLLLLIGLLWSLLLETLIELQIFGSLRLFWLDCWFLQSRM